MQYKEYWHPALAWLVLVVRCAALLIVACCGSASTAGSVAGIGPTVKQVVEFRRLVQPESDDPDRLRALVSPDGRRAFIVTRKAEVDTDKNLFDILLLDLTAERLRAGRYEEPRLLLRVEARKDDYYVMPSIQDARWAGDRTIVFLGRLQDAAFQVYKLDVDTRRVTQLTFSRLPIVSFDISGDLNRVAYVAQVSNPPAPSGARSVVVGNQSFWSVKFGQNDMRQQLGRHQYFVAASGSRVPARALGDAFQGGVFAPRLSISPDGQWVLAPRYEPEWQSAWARQYPIVGEATAKGASLSVDPLGYFSRPTAYVARRMVAYRVKDGSAHSVLDAPDDAVTNAAQWRSDRLWQGRGESVVLAGTHLPIQAGQEAVNGSHIIEYWPASGRWEVIAALDKTLTAAYRVAGARDAFVALDGDLRRYFERKAEGGWRELDAAPEFSGGAPGERTESRRWSLRVAEGVNQPADVVAKGPDGQSLPLTKLNPQYAAASWGVMQTYAWKDEKGRQWDGGLMTPPGFVPGGAPRPLVIQTYQFFKNRFYLDGPLPGFSSGFGGRAFLRGDMLVLAMPWGPSTDLPSSDRGGVDAFMDGVQGAIDALVKSGLVDPERVGILGWSATGERVLNLVTFSKARIRAASLLDGDSNTLFSFTVTYAAKDLFSRKESINEARPFGESLARWVRNDPALHSDCVRAAMRIESYGPLVLNNWDIYALLRRQYKAAEMVVIPEGAHSLSRPSERMISLQGNVDWYRFWLKGEERTDLVVPGETAEGLRAQYVRWRQMAELKRADDAKPRCARTEGAR